jgi:putative ATP-dependent endonuclease of OLD family
VKVDDDESPGCKHTNLHLVSKKMLVRHCEQTGVPKGKATSESISEFYKATSNPMLNEAFFARFVMLVEGDTEELALPIFLSKAGFDCDLLGISIISVRGKGQIPKYWRLFSAFRIPLLVIADNDVGKNAGESNKPLAECFVVDERELLEVEICKLVQSKSKPVTPILMMEDDYETALRKDLEVMEDATGNKLDGWAKEATELIKPVGNQSKGQVARFIARRICAETAFVPKFVAEITAVLTKEGFQSKKMLAENAASFQSEPRWEDDESGGNYWDPDDIPF